MCGFWGIGPFPKLLNLWVSKHIIFLMSEGYVVIFLVLFLLFLFCIFSSFIFLCLTRGLSVLLIFFWRTRFFVSLFHFHMFNVIDVWFYFYQYPSSAYLSLLISSFFSFLWEELTDWRIFFSNISIYCYKFLSQPCFVSHILMSYFYFHSVICIFFGLRLSLIYVLFRSVLITLQVFRDIPISFLLLLFSLIISESENIPYVILL